MSTNRLLRSMLAAGLLLGAPAVRAQDAEPTTLHEPSGREASALARVPAAARDNAVVLAWNLRAYQLGFAEDQFQSFKGARAHAMMHLAMHDALNAIVPVYRQYAYLGRDARAQPLAAVSQAAHDVLASQYPQKLAELDAELQVWLGQAGGAAAAARRGVALGRRAAAAVLAARADDGWDLPGSYRFRDGEGAYRTTPVWDGFVLQPGFRGARPFALASAAQFRPPAPPALASPEYALAYAEVKDFGAAGSTHRSAEQTAYALWWMEFTEGSMNRLARDLAARRRLHLWRAARLFALLDLSMFDGYLANWDSKFEYDHWRPYTAIREAGADPNPATEADSDWQSLRPAPPFPEYASAHATVCASSCEILRRTFGDRLAFSLQTTTAAPGEAPRSYPSFSAAAEECADSRVRLGWHFRYATDAGLTLGRAVASHAFENHLALAGPE